MARLDEIKAALCAATRRLVTTCGGPQSAALITRIDAPRLTRYGQVDRMEMIPVDVIADLERDCADPVLTRELARQAGYLLIAAPQGRPGAVEMAHMGSLAKEHGEALERLIRAWSNGNRITADEIRSDRLIEEVDDLILVAVEIRAGLVATLEAQGDE